MNEHVNDEPLPIVRLLPNVVTIIGLCVGLFGLRYAISGKWELAVSFILLAGVIDGMDGRIARLLNASSNFGAQLDSLADFFNFGVAPAFLLYFWRAGEVKGAGWAITLFFIISQALRLARFNAGLADDEENKKLWDKFFKGIPAPCGAALSMLPIILTFLFEKKLGYNLFNITPGMVIAYMALIALLMISTIPTISIKKVRIKREKVSIALALAGIFVVLLIIEPWVVLPIVGILYLATIPFSMIAFYRRKMSRKA